MLVTRARLHDEVRILARRGRRRIMLVLVRLVLRDHFFHGNALVLGLAFGFFVLDLLVMREVLEVLWVDVGLLGLGLRRGVELLWG